VTFCHLLQSLNKISKAANTTKNEKYFVNRLRRLLFQYYQ